MKVMYLSLGVIILMVLAGFNRFVNEEYGWACIIWCFALSHVILIALSLKENKS